MKSTNEIDKNRAAEIQYRNERREHSDQRARTLDGWRGLGGYYHRRLHEIYKFLVAPNQKILEIGCGEGDLLAALNPSLGVGFDLSSAMSKRASLKHPQMLFFAADAMNIGMNEKFDVIILSDLLNDLWDVQAVFKEVRRLSHPRTRIIINIYSRLWELPLSLAEALHLAKPTLYQNWLTVDDISNLMNLENLETIRSWSEIIWPVRTPIIDAFFNRFLVKLWPFHVLALTNMMIARPQPEIDPNYKPLVSVVVPARNEAGNIVNILERVPDMGGGTEIVFVEGNSTDDTFETIKREVAARPEKNCQILQQTGKGKGDAVRLGYREAKGDIFMILDADLTVPPEDLPRFYDAITQGKGDFINGVRLVYPMEKQAMRFFNLLGNKFFSLAFSWLLGQPVKDSLCGTKVLRRSDYDLIARNRDYFGNFDPFGDFDLLFGAAKQTLKIVDLPIRYRERTYGTTNIQRWSHGWLLLKMVAFAASRIKFV
ncbi:MAG: glycosyltransferase [Chloroflexi bacterium]|nr:glycosyltransferase [Chloroflexota bacterium]BCY16245.1 glycosyl transferase [Leptolinea sp. HRD-7]